MIYQQCGMTRPNTGTRNILAFRTESRNPASEGGSIKAYPSSEFLQNELRTIPHKERIDLLWPGEFVFGYLSAIDPNLPNIAGPDAPGKLASGYVKWARNGSLMVLTESGNLYQSSLATIEIQAQRNDIDPDLLASRMVGRWKSGAPLALTPSKMIHSRL